MSTQAVAIGFAESLEAILESLMDDAERIQLEGPAALREPFGFDYERATDERIRYLNKTGTSVKDSARLAISDTQTDNESGENRYFAVP